MHVNPDNGRRVHTQHLNAPQCGVQSRPVGGHAAVTSATSSVSPALLVELSSGGSSGGGACVSGGGGGEAHAVEHLLRTTAAFRPRGAHSPARADRLLVDLDGRRVPPTTDA